MAWIELHDNLREHRKVYAMCEELNINKATVIGLLGCLWMWCNVYAQDGILTGIPQKAIASACEWTKKPDQLIRALVKCGWIDDDGKGQLAVHDWYDYAGRLIEKRAANADRMRSARASNNKTERASHVQRTERAQCNARAGATVPNHTIPNNTIVDVDKRAREEYPFDNYAYDKFGLPPMTEEDIVFEDVSIACAQAGIIIMGAKNESELDRLIGQYTATWVKEAASRIADKPPEKRHFGMLKAILKIWGDQGRIDGPGDQRKPVSTPGLRM